MSPRGRSRPFAWHSAASGRCTAGGCGGGNGGRSHARRSSWSQPAGEGRAASVASGFGWACRSRYASERPPNGSGPPRSRPWRKLMALPAATSRSRGPLPFFPRMRGTPAGPTAQPQGAKRVQYRRDGLGRDLPLTRVAAGPYLCRSRRPPQSRRTRQEGREGLARRGVSGAKASRWPN